MIDGSHNAMPGNMYMSTMNTSTSHMNGNGGRLSCCECAGGPSLNSAKKERLGMTLFRFVAVAAVAIVAVPAIAQTTSDDQLKRCAEAAVKELPENSGTVWVSSQRTGKEIVLELEAQAIKKAFRFICDESGKPQLTGTAAIE